jgi:hypothetical protein
MKALSNTELKIESFGDELQFTISRESGWIEIVVTSSVITAVGTYGLLRSSVLSLGFCLVGIGFVAFNWAQGPTTTFCVSNRRLFATGNLSKLSDADVSIPASDVKSISWGSGPDDGPTGIYVWHGQEGSKCTCVLPGVSKKKAQGVTEAISKRFPQFPVRAGETHAALFTIELGN